MRVVLVLFLIVCFSCSQKTLPNSQNEPLVPFEFRAVQIAEGKTNLGPCEPSICIDPNNKNNIIAGAVLDQVFVSEDGGSNWTKGKMNSSFGVYGDPVIAANYKGDFFYAHLSNPAGRAYASEEFLDRIVIQKTSDLGRHWTDGSHTLPRSPKDQDKQWLAVDPDDNTLYITWTEFDLYNSQDSNHHSRILFSKSLDDGDTWSAPQVLSQLEGNCLDDDQTTEGAVPCVGPNGQVYVSWSYNEKIYFDKSYDQGKTWLKEDIVAVEQPGGWTFNVPGITRCNGMPITCVDRSKGKHRGTIYINWGDQRNGTNDTDIWLSSSEDEGNTWSKPVRVNDDNSGKHQFLSWMDIDQKTGHIYIVFYDRRAQDGATTDVYLAVSKDGGRRFENHKINETSFTPNPSIFFGDYNDISVVDGRVRPIWTQLEGRTLSIWTSLIEY